LAAPDVGGEVLVAEREPVRAGAVGGEFGPDLMRLRVPPPALVLVDAAAQGVHDGVQVRADPQAEQRYVVARVPDDRDLGVGRGPAQAAKKTGGTHATREHGDAHNIDVLPALNDGDSSYAVHAALRWVPASAPTATMSGLTPVPQAFSLSARPAARMFLAAFTSRS